MAETYSRTINIYVESGEAQRAYDKLKVSQDTLNKKIQTYLDQGKQVPEKLAKQFEAVNKQLDIQSKKLSGELSPSMRDLSSTASKLNSELSRMSREDAGFEEKRRQATEAKKSLDNYKTSISTVKASLIDMATVAKGVAFGAIVGNFATSAAQFILSGFTTVTSAISDLEGKVKNLSAITGASGTDLEFLKQKAIELAQTGSRSASDYVEAMKFIASAKPELLENRDALAEVTKAAKLLANAGGIDLQEAAKRLTDALNQFGAPAEDAALYVDRLAAAAKYGSAEIPEITEALLQFGPIAKQAGVDIQESSAAIELLAEKGYKGAEAGTKLRNILLNLSAVDALPAEAIEQLEKYGVNTEILTDNTISLADRLQELSKISGDATAMVKVFDKQNVSAATSLLTNIDRLRELNEQIGENGVAASQAAANTSTLSGAWSSFKNFITTLFLNIPTEGLTKFVKGVTEAASAFADWAGWLPKTSELLEKERQELLLTETQISSYNVGSRERTELIKALQDKYPQYLSNLNAEKVSNEEIAKAIGEINNQLLFKIALAQKDEALQKQLGKVAKITNETAEAKLNLEKELTRILNNSQLADVYKDQNKAMLEGLPIQTKVSSVLSGMIQLYGVSRPTLASLASAYDKYTAAVAKSNIAIDEKNKLLQDFQSFQKNLKETLGIEDVAVSASPIAPIEDSNSGSNTNQSKLDKDLSAWTTFVQKVNDLKAQSEAAMISQDEREILAVQQKYEALNRELKKFHDKHTIDLGTFNNTQKTLTQAFNDEMEALSDKQFENRSEKEYAATLIVAQNHYEQLKAIQKKRLANGEINEREYNAIIRTLDAQAAHAKVKIAQDYTETSKKAANDLVKFQNDAYQQDVDNAIAADKQKKDAKKTAAGLAMDTAKITGDYEYELSLKRRALDEEYEAEMAHWRLILEGKEENEAVLTAIQDKYKKLREGLTEEETGHTLSSFATKAQGYLQYGQQILQIAEGINQIITNQENAQLEHDKRKNNELVKNYGKQLQEKRISQKLHDILVDQANKAMAKKEDEIKKAQFERNKAFQIANAFMAGAQAVLQALASGPPPGNFIMAGLAGVAAGIQIGVISSTQYVPSYGDGTARLGGERHSGKNGGNPVIDPRTGKVIAKVEEGEAIIPQDATANNPEIVNMLLNQGRSRNLLSTMRPVSSLDISRNLSNIEYASGGVFGGRASRSGNSNVNAIAEAGLSMAKTNELLKAQTVHLKKIADKDVSVSIKETNKKSATYNDILTNNV